VSKTWDTSFENDRNLCRAAVESNPDRPKPLPANCDIHGLSVGTMRAMGVDFLHPGIPDCAVYDADASNRLSRGVRVRHVFTWAVTAPDVGGTTLEQDVFIGNLAQCRRWDICIIDNFNAKYRFNGINGEWVNPGDTLIRTGVPGESGAAGAISVLVDEEDEEG